MPIQNSEKSNDPILRINKIRSFSIGRYRLCWNICTNSLNIKVDKKFARKSREIFIIPLGPRYYMS